PASLNNATEGVPYRDRARIDRGLAFFPCRPELLAQLVQGGVVGIVGGLVGKELKVVPVCPTFQFQKRHCQPATPGRTLELHLTRLLLVRLGPRRWTPGLLRKARLQTAG